MCKNGKHSKSGDIEAKTRIYASGLPGIGGVLRFLKGCLKWLKRHVLRHYAQAVFIPTFRDILEERIKQIKEDWIQLHRLSLAKLDPLKETPTAAGKTYMTQEDVDELLKAGGKIELGPKRNIQSDDALVRCPGCDGTGHDLNGYTCQACGGLSTVKAIYVKPTAALDRGQGCPGCYWTGIDFGGHPCRACGGLKVVKKTTDTPAAEERVKNGGVLYVLEMSNMAEAIYFHSVENMAARGGVGLRWIFCEDIYSAMMFETLPQAYAYRDTLAIHAALCITDHEFVAPPPASKENTKKPGNPDRSDVGYFNTNEF